MENTGVYSTRLEETLSKIAPEHVVIQENPTLIHAYRKSLNVKNKTDAMDARVIAKYGRERAPKTKNKLPAEYLLLKAYSTLFVPDASRQSQKISEESPDTS